MRSAGWFIGWLLISGLMAWTPAFAGGPGGDYEIMFGGSQRVWDLSGNYDEDIGDAELGDMHTTLTLVCDGRGIITGSGDFDMEISEEGITLQLEGDTSVYGRVATARDGVRTVWRMLLTGRGEVQGSTVYLGARLSLNMRVNTNSTEMAGIMGGVVAVYIPGMGRAVERMAPEPFSTPLPPTCDGGWTLRLHDMHLMGRHTNIVGGHALVELSNGRQFPLEIVRGGYNSRYDLSVFGIAPARTNLMSRGIALQLRTHDHEGMEIDRAVCRLLGQTVWILPPRP